MFMYAAIQDTDITSTRWFDALNLYVGDDSTQSDGEVPVIVELGECGALLPLPSLPGPLWLGVVSHDRVLSIGQIELNCLLMQN